MTKTVGLAYMTKLLNGIEFMNLCSMQYFYLILHRYQILHSPKKGLPGSMIVFSLLGKLRYKEAAAPINNSMNKKPKFLIITGVNGFQFLSQNPNVNSSQMGRNCEKRKRNGNILSSSVSSPFLKFRNPTRKSEEITK